MSLNQVIPPVGEDVMKLDDSNSRVFNGLRIANKPDETGAYIAEFLPELIPVIPEDEEERDKAFYKALEKLSETKKRIASSKLFQQHSKQ